MIIRTSEVSIWDITGQLDKVALFGALGVKYSSLHERGHPFNTSGLFS